MSEPEYPAAIISDIHGNLEAFQAVLDDIRARNIKLIINLGDVVGYGPDPEACLDLAAEHCSVNLCGNHDYAVLHGADGFNPIARAAVDFARARLTPAAENPTPESLRRWSFLEDLETIYECEGFEAMHASPRHPIVEYVLPSDPEMDPGKIRDTFAAMNRPVAFIGHTHFPGIIEESQPFFLMPRMFDQEYQVGDERVIVNVGSVGQPRDHDQRSCYVVFDGQVIRFRRVKYDIETTIRKVSETGSLHDICGLRLREGR